MGTRWKVQGRTFNIPEDKLDAFMDDMDKKGLSPTSVDDEEVDAGEAPQAEMTVGTPEVIRSEKPLGRSLNMTEVREATPEAPSGGDWLRGLLGGSEDPTGFSAQASTMQPTDYGGAPRALGSMVAGGVHGYTAGLDRAAGQMIDAAAPVRQWSMDAERDNPALFAAGDFVGSFASPVNKIAAAARFIKPGVGRVLGEVGEQMAIGAGEDAVRQYGDTGQVEAPGKLGAAATAAFALPGALVSNAAARSAARQATPEARALRAQDADHEFLRSAGYDDKAIDELAAQPEKYGNVLSEIRRIAGERGGSYTVPEMASSVQGARDEARLAKDAAVEALTQGGATVDPMDIHDKFRADVRERSPAAAYGAPLSSDYVAGADAIAQRYADSGMGIPGGRIMEPVERVSPVQAAPPAPDPVGALAAAGGPQQVPPAPPPLPTMTPPPSAAPAPNLPPTPAPASAFGSLLGASPESSAFGALGASPAPVVGDPIGALAAQASPPPMAAQALPPPPLPVANQSPATPVDPDAWMRGLGAQAPAPAPMADLGPAPVPFNAYLDELNKAGQPIRPELAKPEDAFARERYAAIDHAMDLGAERADPELATQWADSKAHLGTLNLLRDQASSARHDAPPFFDVRNSALGSALGSVGGGLAYSLGAGALGASGLGALGAGAGMAVNHWYQPRKHSIHAQWLSGDTADMMERVSEKARMPVGAEAAAIRDGFRPPSPPPAAADEKDPNGPTSSLQGMPAGMTLGRDTTASMKANPSAFMPWADDYNKARTDDARAAVTERLVRTDPIFVEQIYAPQIQRSNA
jgi:hypothetical protein